ncbi:MAG TPA: glycosyltransferase family 39 protein, partial [Gemmata sp.]|nr:glycosyltransferase family 39 protein [Gemmata sp.]
MNYDDDIYPQNFNVQNGLQIEYLLWAFTAKTMNQWHPLTWISLQLDTEVLGSDPIGYHCTNLLLHALNTVLLFWLLRMATNRVYPSAVVAALFSIHPLHVESVAWVTARKDVLSTFFMLLMLLFYVKYARKPALGTYLTMVCFFLLGLLAKPMPVTLPLVMLLFDYWPLHRTCLPEPKRE